MLLVCTARCGGTLFRAVEAEVEVDAAGDYQSHRILQPGFVCLACGSPALDLGEVPNEINAEREADLPPETYDVLCPVCETAVTVGTDLECPNCGAELELEFSES